MSKFEWTKPQQAAIDARGEILVSAAAGSGKTAVLVERVMRMLADECDIDQMLIVTFTRAAAAQMKEKIAASIAEKLAANPQDRRMLRQQVLLEKAQITTIDSFCADVLKNNFQALEDVDISMQYQNLDAPQFAVLSREVADEVLGSFYDSGDKEFLRLMDVFTSGKNDTSIYRVIDVLHLFTSAFADKEKWLHAQTDLYLSDTVANSLWGQLLLKAIGEFLSLALEHIEHAQEIVRSDEATDAVYGELYRADAAMITAAYDAAQQGDWNKLYAMKQISFSRFPQVKKNIDETLRAESKYYRGAATDAFWSAMGYVIESEEEFAADNASIYPVVKQLQRVFEAYEQRLFEKKLERQCFEFSDIAYLAMKILADENRQPTEIALEYRKKFKAILVDEYQDTNDVQDLIFETISENNLFVVGDVKQSIYRFRQAMPEIFIRRKKALEPYEEGKASGYILLKNNFRSEKPITDFVNFLFKKLMSEQLGDVDYNEDEYLIPGLKKDDTAPAPELHILDDVHLEGMEKIKKAYYEARYIAEWIKQQVENGETTREGDEQRALDYGDFCVLVRSKTHLPDLETAFAECGVPCVTTAGERLFDTPEISLVMSFLRAVDNPLRDVDLIAVMYSELFGFTAEELALIRIASRKGSFYAALTRLAQSGNEKCRAFLAELEYYRTAAATMEPAEFLRAFYERSAFAQMLGAQFDGALKQANLYKFASLVEMYAQSGYFGLSGLVRFLEKVKQNDPDIAGAFLPAAGQKVKIMTVHASKGLEFPVVIFAYTNNSNNHYGSNIVLNREYGVGIKAKDIADNTRYDTIAYSAVSLANLRNDIAEELRTLYVALTRAKTRLIITGTFDGKIKKSGCTTREEKIASIALLCGGKERLNQGWMRLNNNYLSWLIACALRHPQAQALRAYAGNPSIQTDTEETGAFKVVLPEYYPEPIVAEDVPLTAAADEALVEQLEERFTYRYAYAGSENIESKITPSVLAHKAEQNIEYAFEPPAFALKQEVNAAGRGTATHRFMEKVVDFAHFDFEKELAAMRAKGFLSEAQAKVIDRKAIEAFFESELAADMARAQRLEKEYAVAYLESAGFFDPTLPPKLQNEKVFVDGLIDAVYVENGKAVIVDYKTDRVKSAEELSQRYRKQMLLYRRAIEKIWGIPVKQCYLYSFHLHRAVAVQF